MDREARECESVGRVTIIDEGPEPVGIITNRVIVIDVNTTIKCPKCRQYLIRESEVKPYGKLFNLHCLECNHYFVENFKRHGYHYLIDSI